MNTPKKLETERLILEGWRRRDAADLFEYARDPRVGPDAGWAAHTDIRDSRHRIRAVFRPAGTWKITDKSTGKAIGSVGLVPDIRRPRIRSCELGYSLSAEYWGRGLMTEACSEVLRYAFEDAQYDIVAVTTAPGNTRSRRVIEKLGFEYEGTLRSAFRIYDGSVRDVMCFSMFREEWEEYSDFRSISDFFGK